MKWKFINNWGCFIYNQNGIRLNREQYELNLVRNLKTNQIGRIVFLNTLTSMEQGGGSFKHDDIRFITKDLILERIDNDTEFEVLQDA